MSRPLRIEYSGAVYHVINRGAARQTTFVDGPDYQAFLNTLGEAHRRWGIEVFSYCFDEQPLPCLFKNPPKGNFSRVMPMWTGLNRHHHRDGALEWKPGWNGRGGVRDEIDRLTAELCQQKI